MSGVQLTIGGGSGSTGGVISISPEFGGATSVPGSIAAVLQQYLAGIDPAGLAVFTTVGGAQTVPASATNVVVETPGTVSLTGAASTSFALFGATSNVNYSVSDGGATSIYAGGGDDTLTLRDGGVATLNATIAASGNDTLNLIGVGNVFSTVVSGATASYDIGSANSTITAEGNATVSIGFDGPSEAGHVYFINNSTAAATVFSSVFTGGQTAQSNVTAFGGAGGGFFDGGQGGGSLPNLEVGGAFGSVTVSSTGVITQVSADSSAGAVTLVGSSAGDILDAQGGGAQNDFFGGSGSETMIAASSTGSNLFQLGLNYPGLRLPTTDGLVSTDGSGQQNFFLGKSDGAQLYGSTVTGSTNVFTVVSDTVTAAGGGVYTMGGGNFGIHNFTPGNDFVLLADNADTANGTASILNIYQDPATTVSASALYATDIALTDGTVIKLYGVAATDVQSATGGGAAHNQTFIFTK